MPAVFRYLWALPGTLLGLTMAAAALLTGGGVQIVGGVVEAHGGLLRPILGRWPLVGGGAWALTLGHVVLGQDRAALAVSRAHERVHVRQFERWGPFFIPLYLLAGLWLFVRGRDAYRENPFEIEARIESDPRRAGGSRL